MTRVSEEDFEWILGYLRGLAVRYKNAGKRDDEAWVRLRLGQLILERTKWINPELSGLSTEP